MGMRWTDSAIGTVIAVAVTAWFAVAFPRERPAGGIRADGARPSDYVARERVGEPPPWADRLTADFERCLREDHAGGVAFPPCRFSCTYADVDAGEDAPGFIEAWSEPFPQEACDAWPKPDHWQP